MRTLLTSPLLAGALLSVSALQVQAEQKIDFVEGGYAQMCSLAAHEPETYAGIVLTGSRVPLRPLDVCTLAIREGFGDALDQAGSYNNRGVLLFAEGRFEPALADFEQALRRSDNLPEVHVNRGLALVVLERWQEAVAALTEGITREAPELAKAHYNRGIAHEELGNIRAAYEDYMTAAELAPEWDEPRQELTRFEVRR